MFSIYIVYCTVMKFNGQLEQLVKKGSDSEEASAHETQKLAADVPHNNNNNDLVSLKCKVLFKKI